MEQIAIKEQYKKQSTEQVTLSQKLIENHYTGKPKKSIDYEKELEESSVELLPETGSCCSISRRFELQSKTNADSAKV